jgi:hypothetical protein
MRDNERTIMASLQREAERAPLIDAPPPDVVRRVKRRRTARAAAFVVSIGIVVGISAFALLQLSPLADERSTVGNGPSPSSSPEHTGDARDVTVLASGTDPIVGKWTLQVHIDDQGNSILQLDDETGGGGMGSAPIRDQVFGGLSAGGSMIGPDSYSFEVDGVVSARAARVTLALVDGTELEAALFRIPARYFGDAKAFVIFGDRALTDHRHPGGTLTAYDEDGAVLDVQSLSGPDEPAGTSPGVDAVITQLREVRDVLSRSRGVEPFADFDLTKVEARLPEIPLNTSDSVVPEEVSVRIMDVRHAVLVATAPEAPIMCLSIERDLNPDGGWNFYYGLLDASTFDACRGGWAPYQLPPT